MGQNILLPKQFMHGFLNTYGCGDDHFGNNKYN